MNKEKYSNINCAEWWIPISARLEGAKLEPEGPRAEVEFPTADQGFLSIQGTLLGFCGSQTRGVRSEIRWDPANLTHSYVPSPRLRVSLTPSAWQ